MRMTYYFWRIRAGSARKNTRGDSLSCRPWCFRWFVLEEQLRRDLKLPRAIESVVRAAHGAKGIDAGSWEWRDAALKSGAGWRRAIAGAGCGRRTR